MISGQDYRQVSLQMIKNFLKKYSLDTTLEALEMECPDDLDDTILPDKPLESIIEDCVRRGFKKQKQFQSDKLDFQLWYEIPLKATNCQIVQVDYEIYTGLLSLINRDLDRVMETLSVTDDRYLIISSFKNTLSISTISEKIVDYDLGKSPILSISSSSTEILVTSMDGSLTLLDYYGNVLMKKRDHSKYANRCAITPNYYVTGSYDQYVNIYNQWELKKLKFGGIIESLVSDGDVIYLGVRGEDWINRVELNSLSIEKISINSRDDGHISYNLMDISLNDKMMALYTDSKAGKIVVLRDNQLIDLYGVTCDEYSRNRLVLVDDTVVCTSDGLLVMNLNGENEKILDGPVNCLSFKKYLVSGGNKLVVWQVNKSCT
ncbi:hypothetical protein HK103_004916 [Boothiomyces macroporosus]|uniref:LisH domain-containing protein n=1 Tax=Boothiomyces macroporosus TaxID=261099 RepID=A0AAD5UG04_9FUNG|nr:hypothetical protein HK103_004916 [Boothiomyces macroporosus]